MTRASLSLYGSCGSTPDYLWSCCNYVLSLESLYYTEVSIQGYTSIQLQIISPAHEHILFKFKNLNKNIPVTLCRFTDFSLSCIKPIELNTMYQVKTIVPTFVPTLVPTLGTYFCAYFYILNVSTFQLIYILSYFLCSTPVPLSYLLSLKPYFVHVCISLLYILWSLKGPGFKLYTLLYIQSLFHRAL